MAFCISIKPFVICLCMSSASFDCFCGAYSSLSSSTVFSLFCTCLFVYTVHISVHCEFSVYIVNIFDVCSLLSVLSQQTCSTFRTTSCYSACIRCSPVCVSLSVFRGYRLQDARSTDEGGMEGRSVEKGISSPALYSLSPTCRARGNHFSILHPADFLPNVLFSSLFMSVPLCPSPTLTFLPHSLPVFLFRCLFPSLRRVFLSPHLLNSEADLVSLL